jgi:nicotinate-nucleotide pyrophosphorylase (carboxylating)
MIGNQLTAVPKDIITSLVKSALFEDIGHSDITAQIIPINQTNTAQIITRDKACICGTAWVNEVFKQLVISTNNNGDNSDINIQDIKIEWHVKDGDKVEANTILCTLFGNSRALLTGERTALNFLQTLSATATAAWQFTQYITNNNTKLLDTRKTIPNLRLAQKYAIACGGGYNHRLGLYDAFLIKENHIIAAGSIANAVNMARIIDSNAPVEIEVESLDELKQALSAQADIIMLDNFSFDEMQKAIEYNQLQLKPAKLEVSGNITIEHLNKLSELGVDFISSGALTKHIQAIDLSMRILQA